MNCDPSQAACGRCLACATRGLAEQQVADTLENDLIAKELRDAERQGDVTAKIQAPVPVYVQLSFDGAGHWARSQMSVGPFAFTVYADGTHETPGAALDYALQLAGQRALRGY